MLRPLKLRSAGLCSLLALVATTQPLTAQLAAPSGVSAQGQAVLLPASLGGGNGTGGLGALHLGLGGATTLEVGMGFARGETDDFNARRYTLLTPSVALRSRLAGGRSGLDLLLGGGALMMAKLDPIGANPSELRIWPQAMIGLGVQQQLAGPLMLELSGRGWMGAVRENALTATPGRRKFTVTPDLRIGLAILFQKRPPKPKTLPVDLSQRAPHIPTAAEQIAAPARGVYGRTEVYAADGLAVPIATGTRIEELTGQVAPSTTGTLPERREGRRLAVVYFPADGRDVGAEYRELFAQLATYLQQVPQARFEILGFAELDQQQTDASLLAMAERRATRVQQILVMTHQVDPTRITVTARGGDFQAREPRLARRVEIWAVQATP